MEAYKKAIQPIIDELVKTVKTINKVVIEPFYDEMMKTASIENPRWFHYYKNAKKKKTREKYRLLLQNKFLAVAGKQLNSYV